MTATDEDVVIDLELRDYLSVNAKSAAEGMDELADNTRKAARALTLFDKKADKATRSILQLDAALKKFNSTALPKTITNFDNVNKRVETYTKSNNDLTKAVRRTGGAHDRASKSVKKHMASLKVLTKMAMGSMMAIKLLGMAMAVAGGVAGGVVLLQTIFQISAALVPLISLVAFLPVAIGGLIAIMGSLKVALSGVGEVMKAIASGDGKAFDEALKKLSPTAQKALKDLRPLIKSFKILKEGVQNAFFKPLVGELKDLQPVINELDVGMKNVAFSAGELAKEWLSFIKSASGKGMIASIFKSADSFLQGLKGSIKPLFEGIGELFKELEPYVKQFGKVVGDNFKQFGGWLKEITKDGSLKEWIDSALSTLKSLWGILKNVGGTLKAVLQAAGGMGGFQGLEILTKHLRTWAESSEGQEALKSFFSSMGTIMKAVAPVITTIATNLGALMPTIAAIITNLAPGFTVFLNALGQGLQALAPFFPPLATALSNLLIALSPLLPILGTLVGLILGQLVNWVTILTPIISILAQALAAILGPSLKVISVVLQAIMPVIAQFASVFGSMLQMLIPILQQFGLMLAQGVVQWFQALLPLLPQIIPLLLQIAMVFMEALMEALRMIMPYMPQLITAFISILIALLPMIPSLLQLALAITKSVIAVSPFLPQLMMLAILFLQNAAMLVSFGVKVATTIHSIVGWFIKLRNTINEKMAGLRDLIMNPFEAFNTIKGWIEDAIGAVGRLISRIGEIKMPKLDLNPFRFAGGDVQAGTKYTVGEIGPELFVPKFGMPQMIGTGGMETRSFGSDGFIIPSFMLDAMNGMQESVGKQLASTGGGSAGVSHAEALQMAEAAAKAAAASAGDNIEVNIDMRGNTAPIDERKLKKAVKAGIMAAKKEAEERS